MDNYGNVPIVTTYGDFAPKANTPPGSEVFTFLETEIKAVLPDLSDVNDITTYGRPTKWMAQALLASKNVPECSGIYRYCQMERVYCRLRCHHQLR